MNHSPVLFINELSFLSFSKAYTKRGNSVGIVIRLPPGRPRDGGLFPTAVRDFLSRGLLFWQLCGWWLESFGMWRCVDGWVMTFRTNVMPSSSIETSGIMRSKQRHVPNDLILPDFICPRRPDRVNCQPSLLSSGGAFLEIVKMTMSL
jgi:hypothetical protein